jgi:catechol 2,3-dioxygenase-like lactoylglutathione lyase family enzyme
MAYGFAHLGLATHDMAATIAFYEGPLGFPRVADTRNEVRDGGVVRMVYFQCGDEQFLVFMEARGVANIADDFDTGINGALGLPAGLYHLAFKLPTVADLERKKQDLEGRNLTVSEVVDHGYARSIYLRDPNDLQLEFCCMTRAFGETDLHQHHQVRIAPPAARNEPGES